MLARQMADNAFEWAKPRGLWRKSEIHGAEEADIPLDFEWTHTNESGNRVSFNSKFTMDAPKLHLTYMELFMLCWGFSNVASYLLEFLPRILNVLYWTLTTRIWPRVMR